jgi:outer membrane protein OmpA-like peptidoglycan-associated protein
MNRYSTTLSVTLLSLVLGGCATNKAVDEKIAQAQAETNRKIESVAGQVEQVQQHQKEQDTQIATLSQEAKDALQRAQEAGVLAKGKVVFEQRLTDDKVHFKVDSADLSKESKAALDDVASQLKAIDSQYFVEIQGHTDDTGGSRYNDELGQRRADAARRYLSRQHQIPLNRMSTISYGDTLPVASNKKKAGRAQNRRVVIVVLE